MKAIKIKQPVLHDIYITIFRVNHLSSYLEKSFKQSLNFNSFRISVDKIDQVFGPEKMNSISGFHISANLVRLIGGSSCNEGNVWAVNSLGRYGPVCDDYWDNNDARVVCRQLGYSSGTAVHGKLFKDYFL